MAIELLGCLLEHAEATEIHNTGHYHLSWTTKPVLIIDGDRDASPRNSIVTDSGTMNIYYTIHDSNSRVVISQYDLTFYTNNQKATYDSLVANLADWKPTLYRNTNTYVVPNVTPAITKHLNDQVSFTIHPWNLSLYSPPLVQPDPPRIALSRSALREFIAILEG